MRKTTSSPIPPTHRPGRLAVAAGLWAVLATATSTTPASAAGAKAPNDPVSNKPTATTASIALKPFPSSKSTIAQTPARRAIAKPGALHLGYFPNITHGPALAGIEGGFFAKALGPKIKIETTAFNAGPAAIEALLSGAVDASYVGPNPAINAFVRSNGKAIRIIAGSTSGGAFLVTKQSITKPQDLKGKKIATPQLGGTQDVALRYWLQTKNLSSTLEGGGDVSVVPQDNAQTLETFRSGAIDGAWIPEPWATRLVLEAGAHVLVDERDLWPKKSFTTTVLIVRTDYLKERPDIVQGLLAGQIATIDFLRQNPKKGRDLVNNGIEKLTGRKLAAATISSSWGNLTFTNDPGLKSMQTAAEHAVKVGLLTKVDLKEIGDLTLLNQELAAAGAPQVSS